MLFSKYVWLLPLVVSILLLSDYLNDIKLNVMSKCVSIIKNTYSDLHRIWNLDTNQNHKVFTVDELKKYTNVENGLYISILGQVFDVTKGAKHYGPGATYHGFTGRDGSLAFITGEFDNKGLIDDVSSLNVNQVKELNDWVQFYHKNYIYIGKLSGKYYNEDGSPTEKFHDVQNMLAHAMEMKFEEEQRASMFPPCNIEWNPISSDKSETIVWCTKKSGGIKRDWVGVPRILFDTKGSIVSTCVCVNLDNEVYENYKGKLVEYHGCPETATKCIITDLDLR